MWRTLLFYIPFFSRRWNCEKGWVVERQNVSKKALMYGGRWMRRNAKCHFFIISSTHMSHDYGWQAKRKFGALDVSGDKYITKKKRLRKRTWPACCVEVARLLSLWPGETGEFMAFGGSLAPVFCVPLVQCRVWLNDLLVVLLQLLR